MLNNVNFIKGEGGLARTLPGKDHYAGLIFYSTTKPASWGANATREITSLKAAEDLDITADSATPLIQAIHYHLKRFFAVYTYLGVSPKLWLTIADEPAAAYDFAEVTETQNFAAGEIRTMGVFVAEAISTTNLSALNTVAAALDSAHKPLSVIATFDTSAVVDWTIVTDLRGQTCPKVSISIGQDGGNEGAALWDDGNLGFSLGDLGSVLAWATVKSVSENIAWPEKFPVAFDGEFDVPALSNGDLVSENEDKLDGLNTMGYIFLRKHVGLSGSYFNDSHTATDSTSDYAYLENNQTIDKAIRGVYAYLIKQLNRPISIDPASGKMDVLTVGFLENEAQRPLSAMISAGELSGASVAIDPDQNVLSTSIIYVNIKLVINGVARTITVKIGFSQTV